MKIITGLIVLLALGSTSVYANENDPLDHSIQQAVDQSVKQYSDRSFACNSLGWTLVKQGMLSVGERVCTYQKNGYQTSIVVRGFCPFHPC
jgi:hypothetical protein